MLLGAEKMFNFFSLFDLCGTAGRMFLSANAVKMFGYRIVLNWVRSMVDSLKTFEVDPKKQAF